MGLDDVPWFIRAGVGHPHRGERPTRAARGAPGTAAPGRFLVDGGDGWQEPHEEGYTSALIDGEIVVTREVMTQGAFGFAAVEVRSVGGGPARLA